jgi:2,4-diketo-3-deoxy-L-fuconate hydrolase
VPGSGLTAPFALGTFASSDTPFPGLVAADHVLDLRTVADRLPSAGPLSTRDLLEHWTDAVPVLHELLDQRDTLGPWLDLSDLHVCAPIEPRQIIQAGANYRKHVIDLAVQHAEISAGRTEAEIRAETAAMMDRRSAEGIPYFFIGLPSAITGPYDDVELPDYSAKHDWELELAAVIGTRAFHVEASEALDHVAAYTIVNDLTTRDLVFRRDMPEIGTDWFRAKNAPGFLPLGPYLVPSEYVGDPAGLQLTLRLNGDVMQDESAKDMIFDVASLIAHASQTTPLLPGDLVLTGSPAGNGIHHGRLLRDGDVMESTITGLGYQRTRCVGGQSQ